MPLNAETIVDATMIHATPMAPISTAATTDPVAIPIAITRSRGSWR
jgi:hypothetical protein